MESKAVSRFLMISPRKVRLVADEIRGFSYPEAVDILRFIPRKGARMLEKALKSARANASVQSDAVRDDQLFVKKLYIDGGPVMKRWRARAKGRGVRILKRTSHITVVLGDK
ncbi:MAG: 50S ribosomal protein L22 [Leptospirales bacterium]|nr:50S ribosomal protein L22 [Leptospirales bacterium]